MKCGKHPDYSGCRQPKVECLDCYKIREARLCSNLKSMTVDFVRFIKNYRAREEIINVANEDNELTGVQDINWKHN